MKFPFTTLLTAVSLFVFLAYLPQVLAAEEGAAANFVAGHLLELNDNGAWSWFMDPRVIVDKGRLMVGSVRKRLVQKPRQPRLGQRRTVHPRFGKSRHSHRDAAREVGAG